MTQVPSSLEGKEPPGHMVSAWVPAQLGLLDEPGTAYMQGTPGRGGGHAAGTVRPSRL